MLDAKGPLFCEDTVHPSRGWWGNAFRAVPLISSSFVASSTIPLLRSATININCVSNFVLYVGKWWASVRSRCCLSSSCGQKRLQVTFFFLFILPSGYPSSKLSAVISFFFLSNCSCSCILNWMLKHLVRGYSVLVFTSSSDHPTGDQWN